MKALVPDARFSCSPYEFDIYESQGHDRFGLQSDAGQCSWQQLGAVRDLPRFPVGALAGLE